MSLNDNTISLKDAEAWTANWRKSCPNNCKAFLIPAEDLTNVLIEMGVLQEQKSGMYTINNENGKDARAYMAIDPAQKEGNGEKLLIVGTKEVNGVYRDIINGKIDNQGDVIDTALNSGSGIYDFTSPCPTACDPNSPLNN